MSDNNRDNDKTILITGGTSGIGKSLVIECMSKGEQVIACGRSQDKLDQLAKELPGVMTLCFDITDKTAIAKAIPNELTIDWAILNAGDCEYVKDVMNFDTALFERVIKVNLLAPAYLAEALIPKINTGGRLAFVSSSVTNLPFPQAEAYGASKAGLDYFAKSLAIDLKPHNIGVSLIHPGFVETPLTASNSFKMPMIINSDDAAKRIREGLCRGQSLIAFPRRFIFIIRLLKLLPEKLWQSFFNKDKA
ncbi:short-chain dehydrogenase [Pseudohongiella nitratireducens]|uniref:Short-chain dehydrogenase n=1 Tax=Pseudohongiella nitratireducens TaxID=1768907 RepID=A0A917LSL9_9GAMM|nr:SDR family NAD(P)-dependent oxidoreductase [Pseudohongiella nitratireducens]MDF1623199.1 SDR family NAD(P)-dependent oxidoreductase [Pseudohongiella nitratireducens]GGG54493.1 short-chain dehydrogenase [Pseudohongiella nitratireducens]|tara:strand:+ start:7003 stop:7749 length:747 start_codon:yes stop_codon:yes gene_type:complete